MTETTAGRRRLIDRLFVRGVADEVELVNSRMLGVGISGPGVRGLKWRPGQQIRVQVSETGLLGALRTYSVWDYDGDRLRLRVYLHGNGPGVEWARRVRPGSDVVFMPPRGEFTVRPAPYHLFVGEDTASVAIGAMLRDITEPVHGVIETDEPEHRLDLPLPAVHRHGAPAAGSALLVEAVAALDLPGHPGIAYVAGEARTCQAVRRHLVVDRGWPRRSVVVKPFWTPGRRGMD